MKTLLRLLHIALVDLIILLAYSCNKQPIIEYDLNSLKGTWIVTSTLGGFVIGHDTVFAVHDTVRFDTVRNIPDNRLLYVSRPGENRYYDEIRDIHYFTVLGYAIKEDRLSFETSLDHIYTIELIESTIESFVFRLKDNGAEARMKKME